MLHLSLQSPSTEARNPPRRIWWLGRSSVMLPPCFSRSPTFSAPPPSDRGPIGAGSLRRTDNSCEEGPHTYLCLALFLLVAGLRVRCGGRVAATSTTPSGRSLSDPRGNPVTSLCHVLHNDQSDTPTLSSDLS